MAPGLPRAASRGALLGCLVSACLSCSGPPRPDPAYIEEIERYRTDRVQRLQQPDGWLTLLGLFWLERGETTFGSAASNPIVLPDSAAPPVAGRFFYDGASASPLRANRFGTFRSTSHRGRPRRP